MLRSKRILSIDPLRPERTFIDPRDNTPPKPIGPTPTKSTGTVVDNNPITNNESSTKQLAYQKIERDKLIKDIDNNTHTSTPIYQIQKSSGLRTDLFEKLHLINNGIYLLSLYVDDYAKLNIKDAGLLKETLKERIMANLGD